MRVSPVIHGIRGIFPLVRALAPQAISPSFALPALRGLRLAIDATLLVQRLHFADDPHPSRHVIGFYRLITSLRQHGVVPIMVFDHPQKRLALKDREQVKRRHKRELDRVRSRLEHERRGRLQELQAHLDALSELPESERRQVGQTLDEWRMQAHQALSEQLSQPSTSSTLPISSTLSLAPPLLPPTPTKAQTVAYSMHTNWLQLEESLRSGGASQSKGQKILAEAEQQVYKTIATQLIKGQAPLPLPLPQEGVETSIGVASIQTKPSDTLSSLNAMHHSLTKTYDRATSPLSASIYQDCATLSSLMAVPVFWTGDGTRTGGGRIHEAEAYAASLVRSGFADLVASEDSDVLLYEAPLLRGLMGGVRSPGILTREGARGKLEVVCGTRVRTGLFPKSELENLIQLHASSEAAKLGQGTAEVDELYDRMTRSLMLDFALLCGTDFNRTIPGIGPKTALRLLKEHGSISTILRKESKKFHPPAGLSIREYETELRHARTVFLQPPKVRAAARSILGTAASEAAAEAVAQRATSAAVEQVLFSHDADGIESAVAEIGEDAGAGVGASADAEAVDATYCTAESGVEMDDDISTVSSNSITIATSVTPYVPQEMTYDRQKVHDFLRSHNVFRTSSSSSSDSMSPLEEFDYHQNTPSREQEWRDLLDLELGLTSSTSGDPLSKRDTILEQENTDGSDASAATLGIDFFGERKAVACWKPNMEQQIREETSAPPQTPA
ncbi:related to RAD27 - 5' to 3' exonuclease [Ustilago trichophora]|uniref:Related to RAD27 - 5' to 3' exonuclease n=1 Tax=Ustilago trichophora TaxID=86804 RepID=A0A5C3EH60_9BASI|nr:related to RAD27 - 5' to 3' exonuclease [Ustilago trichophora]